MQLYSGNCGCCGCATCISGDVRELVGEVCRKAGCSKRACPVVCPAKAGVFSGRQTRRGKSQNPRSLDSREKGNQISETYRQHHPWDDGKPSGRNESERRGGLENVFPGAEPSTGGRRQHGSSHLTEAAGHSGGVRATARWQGRAKQLEKPSSSRREIGGAGKPYNWTSRKSVEDERVSEGLIVAAKWSNFRGAKQPCCRPWLLSRQRATMSSASNQHDQSPNRRPEGISSRCSSNDFRLTVMDK
jgi:hypothetical protein